MHVVLKFWRKILQYKTSKTPELRLGRSSYSGGSSAKNLAANPSVIWICMSQRSYLMKTILTDKIWGSFGEKKL